MQRRDVECKLPNDTVVDPMLCDEAEKPPVRLECYNDRCKGTWRVGEWSEVECTEEVCRAHYSETKHFHWLPLVLFLHYFCLSLLL